MRRKNLRSVELCLPDGTVAVLRQSFLTCETGGALWDSALVLCEYLRTAHLEHDLSVLELGSGIGAAAVYASALGFQAVTASDADQDVLPLLRANCAPFPRVATRCLAWGEAAAAVAAEFDLVIGADLIYDSAQHAPLLATVASAKRFVLVVRSRHERDEEQFMSKLSAQMQMVRCVEASSLENVSAIDCREIRVYEWKKMSF